MTLINGDSIYKVIDNENKERPSDGYRVVEWKGKNKVHTCIYDLVNDDEDVSDVEMFNIVR